MVVIFGIITSVLITARRDTKKYNREYIRNLLIENAGIIKASTFSEKRLDRIISEISTNTENIKINPHLIYDIVSRTDDHYVN
jgi:short-subunit dehydrogenase